MLAMECILEKAANRLGALNPVPAGGHQITDPKLGRKKWHKEISKAVSKVVSKVDKK